MITVSAPGTSVQHGTFTELQRRMDFRKPLEG